jgi:hypothetical protein
VALRRAHAEGAPHPLERAGVRVENNDPAVAVTVGHERFIGFLVDEHVRRSVDVRPIAVAFALTLGAELLHEFSLCRELQQHVVGDTAAADPDHVFVVDGDAVLGEGPVITLPRATQALTNAVGVEFEDGGATLSQTCCTVPGRWRIQT